MQFEADRHLTLHAEDRPAGRSLRTEGLAAFGRKELAMDGIPELYHQVAPGLMKVAATLASRTPVPDGGVLRHLTPAGMIAIRLVDDGPDLQRAVDLADDRDACPDIALATYASWFSAIIAESEPVHAVTFLRAVLERQPQIPHPPPPVRFLYNWNGATTALTLAQLDPEHADTWLAEMEARSAEVVSRTLGDPNAVLAALDPSSIQSSAALVAAAWATCIDPIGTDAHVLVTSPLAKSRNGMVAFDRAVVPMELFSILLDRSTLELLYASETHALVAHAVSTWGPLGTWLRTKHVVDAFPEHREKVVSSVPWTPGTRLAALLLGDIVLRVGRGASFASLPTLWGL